MYMVKWKEEEYGGEYGGEGIWSTTVTLPPLPTQQAPTDATDGIRLRKEGRKEGRKVEEREEERKGGAAPIPNRIRPTTTMLPPSLLPFYEQQG